MRGDSHSISLSIEVNYLTFKRLWRSGNKEIIISVISSAKHLHNLIEENK